jgi:hypothetical protein
MESAAGAPITKLLQGLLHVHGISVQDKPINQELHVKGKKRKCGSRSRHWRSPTTSNESISSTIDFGGTSIVITVIPSTPYDVAAHYIDWIVGSNFNNDREFMDWSVTRSFYVLFNSYMQWPNRYSIQVPNRQMHQHILFLIKIFQ